MVQGIWKGDINFGLVYIPITLYSAEKNHKNIKLVLLDKRDLARVGYEKTNKNTGKKVPLTQLVEGYEYKDEAYAVLSRDELKKIHPEATQSINIIEFVDIKDIKAEYFEKPYYLEPSKKGKRAYAILRESLRNTKKAGIAKVVLRNREHLAALMVDEKAIILQLLRFPDELIPQTKLDFPELGLAALDIKKAEITMAETLIKKMSVKWNPKKYHDDYQKDLLKYITEKIKLGGKMPKTQPAKTSSKSAEVFDIMALLKKSVEKKKKKKAR
jgi:DNA end-binding protein Ku